MVRICYVDAIMAIATGLPNDVHLNEMESALLDCNQTAPGEHERSTEHADGRCNHNTANQMA
jgi:hypothetical protein